MSKQTLSEDLRRYLTHRLRRVVDDSVDTAIRADLNRGEAVAIIYVAFVHELVMLALATDLSEAELTGTMAEHYRKIRQEKLEKIEARKEASR